MLINNHMLMGENILKYSNCEYKNIINRKRFIWGNIKPDCVFKYKKIKHYYNESINTIIKKIIRLSSLTLEQIQCPYTIAKFSEELGVICHFLCDFFCAPHYYRWECYNTKVAKDHMIYEKNLAKITKTFVPDSDYNEDINVDNIKEFLDEMQKKYDGTVDYENDLKFAYYVCESVLNMIMENVAKNKIKSVI